MSLQEVEVAALDREGYGLVTDKRIRVRGALAQERVQIELPKRARRRIVHPLAIVSASKLRVQTRCPHVTSCGGCSLQHLAYQEQLAHKQRWVNTLFTDQFSQEVPPILASQEIWHYRNKMEFTFSQDRAGNRYLGLCAAQGKGKVVDLQECHLAPLWFLQTLHQVRKWWENNHFLCAYRPTKAEGALRTLTVREGRFTADRLVMLTVIGDVELPADELVQQILQDQPNKEQISVILQRMYIQKGKPTYTKEKILFGSGRMREKLSIFEGHCSLFSMSATAFFQPHPAQAERFYKIAIELAQLHAQAVVYDLFCGIGILALLAAPYVKEAIGVELNLQAVEDARLNAKAQGHTNVQFFCADVSQLLKERPKELAPPDLVFVDPPRCGLSQKTIEDLGQLRPLKIIYISCNPITQANDCKQLKRHGYHIIAMQTVDAFPHTPHVENIVRLDLLA